jgi:peptidoglycan biosynthesis protein MviN/MurJ (putative lipid II flippase)
LIGLGIGVVLLPVLAALSAEQRNSLVKSLMDLVSLISLVKGQP